MSTPILQSIWDSLATALRAINTTAGYHYTVPSGAVYQDMVNVQLAPLAPCIVIGPSEGGSREFKPSMRVRERIVFALEARVDADGTDVDRKAEAYAKFLADIEKALTVDITRGGLAARTLLRRPVGPFMGFGQQAQVLFSQEVEVDLVRTYGVA
jgi:hypothetical protein